MALTKSRTSLNSATTMTAAAGDVTGSTVDISASYSTLLDITLTNGATGPTVPAQVRVQVAADTGGSLWTDLCTIGGGVTNSAVYYFSIDIPQAAQAFRLISGSNTGQNVTLNADYARVTAL